ncbi:hypothetical protein GCM10018793_10080 [Streptomyces sulfonofaciens]|uniref:Integral membrane protein n=1 Tax=Streptomyces sulfonofaciens TaxID=68272 RepID=A0A919FW81_9ACTN|nr:hypothetical protein [Streptomyces sulfonofaciens]GHH72675.1 hypothetical protein GCM10018793_10080 [Streptomyces sulfonofaciens]
MGRGTPARPPPGAGAGRPQAQRPKPWLWRWRSNPLRRREDVVEAWIILIVWIVVAVGGALVGVFAARATDRTLADQRAERHSVTAVLSKDAPSAQGVAGGDNSRVRAEVHWTGPDGSRHTGHTMVDAGHRAGSEVRVWTDRQGELTSAPAGGTEAAMQAVLLGGSAAVFFSGVTYAAGRGVRLRLDAVRAAHWDKEWEDVEPRWRHRMG